MAILTALLCAAAVFVWIAPVTFNTSMLGADITEQAQKMNLKIDPAPLIRVRAILVAIGIVWTVFALLSGGAKAAILPVIVMLIGWKLTDNHLNTLQKKRQEEIAREFPLFVQMIRVFSKASDLYVALNTARQLVQGELRQELDTMMQELETYSVRDALRRMAERCCYAPMDSLVSVLISGMETGSDIDEILGNYAKRIYETRVNESKRKIKSQPVIMSILPVMLGFFLLLVLVYPLFSDIIQKLSF